MGDCSWRRVSTKRQRSKLLRLQQRHRSNRLKNAETYKPTCLKILGGAQAFAFSPHPMGCGLIALSLPQAYCCSSHFILLVLRGEVGRRVTTILYISIEHSPSNSVHLCCETTYCMCYWFWHCRNCSSYSACLQRVYGYRVRKKHVSGRKTHGFYARRFSL